MDYKGLKHDTTAQRDIWADIIHDSQDVTDFFQRLHMQEEGPLEVPSLKARCDKRFFPSLPGRLFTLLAPLPGKALAVYMILRLRSRLHGTQTVTLTSASLSCDGVSEAQKRRALACLEAAHLVTVDRVNGKNPRVTLRLEDVPWVKPLCT